MGATPIFTSAVKVGVAVLGTNGVDATNRDGSGATTAAPVTVFTAGSSGSIIEQLVIMAETNPADCTILWFLHDGSAFHLYDVWDIGDPAAGTATVASYRESRKYEADWIPSGWSLRAVVTAAPTTGKIQAFAFYGDY